MDAIVETSRRRSLKARNVPSVVKGRGSCGSHATTGKKLMVHVDMLVSSRAALDSR